MLTQSNSFKGFFVKLRHLTLATLFSATTLLANGIMAHNAYVRATPPGVKNSAAFLEVMNHTGEDLAIVSASSKIAKAVELHTHDMKDGVMKMYQVKKIDLKAHSTQTLKPGGYHVMFLGLNKRLNEGENVNFSLTLSNGKVLDITAPVKKVMAGMKMKHNHAHMKH